jgi:hypothetical protein
VNRGARAGTIGIGIAFGFLVTGSGPGSYATIHQALLLRGWYLFAVFGSAVAVAAAGLALLRRTGTIRYGGPLRLPRGPARRAGRLGLCDRIALETPSRLDGTRRRKRRTGWHRSRRPHGATPQACASRLVQQLVRPPKARPGYVTI